MATTSIPDVIFNAWGTANCALYALRSVKTNPNADAAWIARFALEFKLAKAAFEAVMADPTVAETGITRATARFWALSAGF